MLFVREEGGFLKSSTAHADRLFHGLWSMADGSEYANVHRLEIG